MGSERDDSCKHMMSAAPRRFATLRIERDNKPDTDRRLRTMERTTLILTGVAQAVSHGEPVMVI